MKLIKIFYASIFFLFFLYLKAQKIQMDSYQFGEGLTFHTEDGKELTISASIQPYFETKHYTSEQSLDAQNRFRMRRASLCLDGVSSNKKFKYRLQIDLSGSTEADDDAEDYLSDAYISYDATKNINVTFGQRSTYTDSRELLISSDALQLVERSALTSAFASIKEFGIFTQGDFRLGGEKRLKTYLTITNGDGGNVFTKDHGGLKFGGRIDFLPFGLFTNKGQFREADIMRERTPKLVIGANYSYNDGMSSRRGRQSGTILYLDENNNESLPDFTKYGIDFLFKYKGFSALGEYVKTFASIPSDITQRVRNDGTTSTSFEIDGVQNIENYIKSKMILGSGYNFQLGYLFKNRISVDGRYTHIDPDKYSFLTNATFYNRSNYYTIGISKYLARNYGAKIQTSLTYIDGNGINDVKGNPIDGNEWIGRIMLTLSF